MDYWRDYPPTHVMVAAYLMGGKAPSGKRRHGNNSADSSGDAEGKFNALVRDVASAGGTLNKRLPEIYRQCRN